MIKLFNRIELWTYVGSWRRPEEWVFSIDKNCHHGCTIVSIGFFGVTLLRGDCVEEGNWIVVNEKD